MAFKLNGIQLNGIQLKGGGDKKKTKYVTDKNSPDLKNYNDSLDLHNLGEKAYALTGSKHENRLRMGEDPYQDRKVSYTPNPAYDGKPWFESLKLETKAYKKSKATGIKPDGSYRLEGQLAHFKKPTNKVKYADPKIVEKQKTLQKAGLYKGELDGIMGPKSKAALKTYESNMAKTASKAKPKPKPVPKNKPGQYTKSSQYPGVKNVYDMKTKKIVGMQNKDGKQIPLGGNFTKDWQYPKK